jgi:hypothetical protein
MRHLIAATAVALWIPACYSGGEETEDLEEADIGEAASAAIVTRGALCEYSCAGAATAGCAAVALACTAGTVWTFGGVSIPCGYAVVAACYAIGAGGLACTKLCGG